MTETGQIFDTSHLEVARRLYETHRDNPQLLRAKQSKAGCNALVVLLASTSAQVGNILAEDRNVRKRLDRVRQNFHCELVRIVGGNQHDTALLMTQLMDEIYDRGRSR